MRPISTALALSWLLTIALPYPGAAWAEEQAPPIGKSAIANAMPLLDQLKQAKDDVAAHELEVQIWTAWTKSGDTQIDALVEQSLRATQVSAFDDALAALDTVVARAPEFAEGWNKRATLLFLMGRYDESLGDIKHVLALEPRHFGALSGIGLISLAKGDKAGAILAYQKVLEIDPHNTAARKSIEALSQGGDPI